MRFIVVDDEPTARLHLRVLLEQWGDVDEADNAGLALEMVRDAVKAGNPYSLVCIDLTMPGPNGIEGLSMIRDVDTYMRKGQHTALVVVTASEDAKDEQKARKNRADAYLVKPVTFDKLIDVMNRCGITAPA